MKSTLFFSIIYLAFFTLSLRAQNITRPNIPGSNGLAVNAFTGNLFYQRTDVFIPGRGLSLEVTFSYNSTQLDEQRGVGNGWRLNYDMRYQLTSDQDVIIERMDGRRDLFLFSGAAYHPPAGIFDSLDQYAPNQFQLIAKDGTTYFFENADHKKLTKIADRNNNELNFTYDEGKIASVTDATGRSIQFAWTGDYLSAINDPNFSPHRLYQYEYDALGNLIQYTDPMGEAMRFFYNPGRQLIALTDRNGNSSSLSYTGSGAVRSLLSCGSRLELTYNRNRRQTYVIEHIGSTAQTTTYTFDAEGNLENQQGNCCGYNVAYAYDDGKNITRRTDANGVAYDYTYDGRGNRLADTNADGTATYTYDPVFNQVTSILDRRMNMTSFTYDNQGNLTQVDRPLGVTEEYSFNADGTMASFTDANSHNTTFAYDANGYLTNVDYLIGAESYGYDAAGNLLSITDANSHTVTFTYDALDRPTSVADHQGNTRLFTYDAKGNMIGENDENAHLTEYGYDLLDRLVEVVTPVATYQYEYDQLGNLTVMRDGNQHETQYDYNEQNLLAMLTDAAGNRTRYEYDGNGNLLSRTDANGHTTTYIYDALNRLLEKSYDGNTDRYTYDANGNLTSCSNDDIAINFTYDALDRLETKTYVEWGKTISYTYDGAGNRKTMTDPDGGLTTYEYDELNRLIRIENPSQMITTFVYDDANRLLRQNNGNGTRTEYTYDEADRVTDIVHLKSNDSVLRSFEYTYDSTGNRLSRKTENNGMDIYTYDDANRLTAVSYADGQTESFVYDPAGNRAQLDRNGQITNYTYDEADRLQTAGNENYTFDANGNLVAKEDGDGTTTYSYDGEDRLIQVNLPDATTIDFAYDPFGDRIVKNVDGMITKFVMDGVNNLLELDQANSTQVRYTAAFDYDTWLSMERGGNAYVYHQDALGSVHGLSNASEALENSYDYFAFGSLKGQSGSVGNVIAFTGREWDDEIMDLYYYRNRYYGVHIGRFTTKDRFRGWLDIPLSLNKYNYVHGNPTNYTDPKGEVIKEWIDLAKRTKCMNEAGRKGFKLKSKNQIEDIEQIQKWRREQLGVFGAGIDVIKSMPGTSATGPTSSSGFGASIFSSIFGLFSDDDSSTSCEDNTGDSKKSVKPDLNDSVDNSASDPNKGDQEGLQPQPTGEASCSVGVRSRDPNLIEGPEGVGSERWISKEALLGYTIYFENDPDSATAAAQLVTITQDLDEKMDPNAFRLGDFGFGSFQFEVPANSTHYQARLDVADSLGVWVDVTAGIDYDDRRLFWTFESIDPETGEFTEDPLAGFLPVNDTLTGSGEGFVDYFITSRETAATFDSIKARASIIFDDNDPLITNEEVNLVDADQPASEVLAVRSALDSAHLLVEFTGADVGSGLRAYDVYVRRGNEDFVKWLNQTTVAYAILPASLDSTYCLISIAADSVLNLQDFPPDCSALVTFTLDLLNGCPNAADWVFDQEPIQSGVYRAANSIQLEVGIKKENALYFRAGQEVFFPAGFEAAPGSIVSAKIEACAAQAAIKKKKK